MGRPSSSGCIAGAVVGLAAILGLAILISLGLPRPMIVPPPSPQPFPSPTATLAPASATATALPTAARLPTATPLALPSLTPTPIEPALIEPALIEPAPADQVTSTADGAAPQRARNGLAPTAAPRRTAAPLLPSVSFSAASITQLAEQQARTNGAPLSGLRLSFNNGQAEATGEVHFDGILGLGKLDGPFRVVGRPRLANGTIRAELTELAVNGVDYLHGLYRPMIEALANQVIEQALGGRRVMAVALEGNVATLVFSR